MLLNKINLWLVGSWWQVEVLKEIGCIDADLVVQLKGRVACEMNSGEELICTEILFENQLETLEPEEAVALMSAFVFQQKKTSEPKLTPNLNQATNRLCSFGGGRGSFSVGMIPMANVVVVVQTV